MKRTKVHISDAAHRPISVGGLEVVLAALGVGLHGLLAGLPAGGADLAVLVRELEGLEGGRGHVWKKQESLPSR